MKDPVCGMEVDAETSRYKSTFDGSTYYFCSAGCKRKFDADPGVYISGDSLMMPRESVPIAAGVLYPTFGILLSPIIPAAAMALSSVSLIGNSLRLSRLGL